MTLGPAMLTEGIELKLDTVTVADPNELPPKKFVSVNVIVYLPVCNKLLLRVTRLSVDLIALRTALIGAKSLAVPGPDTPHTNDDQDLPAWPKEFVGSNTILSQLEINDGVDNDTVGTIGVAGADTFTCTFDDEKSMQVTEVGHTAMITFETTFTGL